MNNPNNRPKSLDIENQILREVEEEFGGAYPQMMAEIMSKCPTVKKLIGADKLFYMQECIRIEDAVLLNKNYSKQALAKQLGLNRGTVGKLIETAPDTPVRVFRDESGNVIKLEK